MAPWLTPPSWLSPQIITGISPHTMYTASSRASLRITSRSCRACRPHSCSSSTVTWSWSRCTSSIPPWHHPTPASATRCVLLAVLCPLDLQACGEAWKRSRKRTQALTQRSFLLPRANSSWYPNGSADLLIDLMSSPHLYLTEDDQTSSDPPSPQSSFPTHPCLWALRVHVASV